MSVVRYLSHEPAPAPVLEPVRYVAIVIRRAPLLSEVVRPRLMPALRWCLLHGLAWFGGVHVVGYVIQAICAAVSPAVLP